MAERGARNRNRRRTRRFPWAELRTRELLDVRICDLGVTIESSEALTSRLERLEQQLARASIPLRPRAWLSTDWFAPDGSVGFAVPFFLAHPRLQRLERRMMQCVEGGSLDWCMRLLRHEAGHAVDNAWRLRRRRRWREAFGPAGTPYRESYSPDPRSRAHVLNLGEWYAQSHPVEDFAETFAVWLQPGSRWRTGYAGWSALRKLECVEELMQHVRDTPQVVRTRVREEPVSSVRSTLREYYAQKRRRYAVEQRGEYDDLLETLFPEPRGRSYGAASGFLRRQRTALRGRIALLSGLHPYVVDQVVAALIPRCRELGLQLSRGPREARIDVAIALTVAVQDLARRPHPVYTR